MILVNSKGWLIHNKKRYKCALGKKGISKNKREGDMCTPHGTFGLGPVFYRSDRVKIKTKLRKIEIKKGMAWCDNPKSKYYNKLIFTKKSKETLMRKDHLYDLVVFVKYNSTRVKKNKGSAIFIHVARKNYSPTKGCVALNVKNLKNLLNKINLKTKIKITF